MPSAAETSLSTSITERILREELAERFHKVLTFPADRMVKAWLKILRRLFGEQEEVVLRNLVRVRKQEDITELLFPFEEFEERFARELKPLISSGIAEGGRVGASYLGAILSFDVKNPSVLEAIDRRALRLAGKVNETTLSAIRRELRQGIGLGEGIPKLRDRIMDVFSLASRVRAERIARTETIWAANEGAIQGYRQAGFVKNLIWYCALDERTCDFCFAMHESSIGIDGSFFELGEELKIEGDEGKKGGVMRFEFERIEHPPL